jgi:predicted Zn-dependent peptidase
MSTPSQPPYSDVPQYRRSVLPGGLRIVSERVPAARSLAIGVWVDAGSRDEAAGQGGIAHFIEHAVFKGTHTRRTHQIAQYLEAVGGYLNAFTAKDATCYYARVRSGHLARAVHLLADIVQRPAFLPREVEKEKQVILEELRGIEDDPEDIIHDHLERQLFGTHPLGRPVIGEAATISAITPDDLHAFVRRHHTTRSVVVAAAGDVEHDQLAALCAAEFTELPDGAAPRRRAPRPGRPRTHRELRAVQQAHLVCGAVVPGFRDPRREVFDVLNALLGDGMSSRLFQRVRERHGLAYTVYSALSSYDDAAVLSVYAGTDADNADRARDLIAATIGELGRAPVPARELARAREQVIGGLLLGIESMSTRMTRLGRDELSFRADMPVDRIVANAARVTAADIIEAARAHLDPEAFSHVAILPDGAEDDDAPPSAAGVDAQAGKTRIRRRF